MKILEALPQVPTTAFRTGRSPRRRQPSMSSKTKYQNSQLTVEAATALIGQRLSCRYSSAKNGNGFEFFKILGFAKIKSRVYLKTIPLDSNGMPAELKYPSKSFTLDNNIFQPGPNDFLIEGKLKALTRNYSVRQVSDIFKTENVFKLSVLTEGIYGQVEVSNNDFEQYLFESAGVFRVGTEPGFELVIDRLFEEELMLGDEPNSLEKISVGHGMCKTIKLDICYRDAGNYKTFFTHAVDLSLFPEAAKLKAGDEINMGEYGTLPEDYFFESELHPTAYSARMDHNVLDIEKVSFE